MNENPRLHGRLLGIDHGLRRIGVAVSDSTGLIARELGIIVRTSKAQDFAQIQRHAAQQAAIGLVVGIPQDLERQEQGLYSQADKVKNWAQRLTIALPLPIILWDETMSSHDAQLLAQQLRRKPGQPIDDLAARLILQSYLDALQEGSAEFPG